MGISVSVFSKTNQETGQFWWERTVKYKAIKTANSYKYRFAKNKSKRAIERRVKYPERKIIIPARPYFTLTDDDLNLISNKIAEYLVNK